MRNIFLLIMGAFVAFSCSVTKFVPEGKMLLCDVDVVSHINKVNEDNARFYLKQTPNSKWFGLFGVPYVTAVYTSMGRVWVLIFLLIVMLLFGAALFCGEAARLYRHFATHGTHEGEGANPAISRRDSAVRFLRRLLTPQAALCVLLYLTVSLIVLIRG